MATNDSITASPSAVATASDFAGELAGHEFLMTGLRTGNTDIYRLDPYTGDARNLTRSPGSHQRYPYWSPDGQHFLFTSDRDGTYNLYRSAADGSDTEQLTHEQAPWSVYFPSWARDTNTIVYGLAGPEPGIFSIEGGGPSQPIRIADGRDPHVSPDGSKIAFTRWVEDGYCVFVMQSDGADQRQVTGHRNQIGAVTPTFSPDGKQLLYCDSVGHTLEIFLLDLTTGESRQLTHLNQFSTSPAWSPDQQWISFRLTDEAFWIDSVRVKTVYAERQGDKRPVWTMRADGSEPHVLEALRYQCGIDGSRAVWNPTGRSK